MAKGKIKTVFFCKECGYETSKWSGQCPGCRRWNTLVEEKVSAGAGGGSARYSRDKSGRPRSEVTGLFSVSMEAEDRISAGIPELDRVLGGGIVKGFRDLILYEG